MRAPNTSYSDNNNNKWEGEGREGGLFIRAWVMSGKTRGKNMRSCLMAEAV